MAPITSIFAPFVAAVALLAPLASAAPQLFRDGKFIGLPIANAEALNLIPSSYIVVYNSSMDTADIDASQASIMSTIAKRNVYKRSLDGRQLSTRVQTCQINKWRALMLDADDKTILDIMKDPTVAYVEGDAKVHLSIPETPVLEEDGDMHALPVDASGPLTKRASASQAGAPSGLFRLSSSAPNGATTGTYTFDETAGQNITVYVVDTGVRTTHAEFEGRAEFTAEANFIRGSPLTDENGHGSHCAGTIAGKTFGVAKKANIVGVKVLDKDGSGQNSGVIAGMNFVAKDVAAKGRGRKAVMNMSLGGGASKAVNDAINNIRAAGVVPVVAAGNENQNAINSSPASATAAITVGAIDQRTDAKASFSNFGDVVDIFAPGVQVVSVDAKSDTGSKPLSGTSMASPHVAGLAAYLMALDPTLTAGGALSSAVDKVDARMKALSDAMKDASGAEVKSNTRGTTNRIANNGNI
ncbi:hypothetical protein RB594_003697 [Gaeumannomyces avenae]